MGSQVSGQQVSFKVQNASAFLVYGGNNVDHGTYFVTVDSSSDYETPTSGSFNGTSHWWTYGSILYWQSGLDQSETYLVTIQNGVDTFSSNGSSWFDIESVVTLGAMGNASDSDSSTLSKGALAGIVVCLRPSLLDVVD
jgi:hypothetical protein